MLSEPILNLARQAAQQQQGKGDTGALVHRGTGAQGHRGTGAQGHRGTGAQGAQGQKGMCGNVVLFWEIFGRLQYLEIKQIVLEIEILLVRHSLLH